MNTQKVKMQRVIGSLNKGVIIPLMDEDAPSVHKMLKERGARIGLDAVKSLLDGTETDYRDFRVMTLFDGNLQFEEVSKPVQKAPEATRTAQNASEGKKATKVPAAVFEAPKTASGKRRSVRSRTPRGEARNYEPKGKVVPLLRSAAYTKVMAHLFKTGGATIEELQALTDNTTTGGINYILLYSIKDKGYGLKFDEDTKKFSLIMPNNQKELIYRDQIKA